VISSQFLQELKINPEALAAASTYPLNLPVFRNFDTLKFNSQVTYLVGENGMGKSTLLEAIALGSGLNPEGGSRHFNFSTRASHSDLYQHIRLSRGSQRPRDSYFLRSESFFNVATQIDELGGTIIQSYGGRSLHEQSHGESFWALFMNRFRGNGLYILDEPEAALSPTRQMAMLVRIQELVNQNSQFIIATHSPIVLAYPDALIYELSPEGIRATSYLESEVYAVSREFLNNPERMIKILLGN
jgi:predicted ATPase